MRWHEYLACLPAEDYDRLVDTLTLGTGHLQLARRLHRADARATRVVGALGAAYAALAAALAALEGTAGPSCPRVPGGAVREDDLPRRWRSLLEAREREDSLLLVGALDRAARAATLVRQLTAADAPVAAIADALRSALRHLEDVRQLVAA